MTGRWLATGLFILLVALFLAIGLYVHSAESQVFPQYGIYQGNVTFLEHNLIANGSVINGSAYFRNVDFPNYWFNENTRVLNGNIDFAINQSLLLIFGDSLTLRGNFGAGTGNALFGIYSLPVQANQAIIYYVDGFGTVGIYVNNRSVTLQPGQEYAYNETETVRDGNATVRINYQHLYLNHGTIPKATIQSRMVV